MTSNGILRSLLTALFLASAVSCFVSEAFGAEEDRGLVAELNAIVQKQAKAWNRGDIDGFMQAYWKSDKLTFSSGGGTTRGWDATIARYKKRYPDLKTRGKLSFTELEVQTLGDAAAMMLGRWQLERDDAIGGNFTLVWRKLDVGWVIVHDHTSSDAAKQ
ncbi:MAG: hypothetical protein Aurels2KO_23560 [Aureliella sp.]